VTYGHEYIANCGFLIYFGCFFSFQYHEKSTQRGARVFDLENVSTFFTLPFKECTKNSTQLKRAFPYYSLYEEIPFEQKNVFFQTMLKFCCLHCVQKVCEREKSKKSVLFVQKVCERSFIFHF
jgi:hypothetical protein